MKQTLDKPTFREKEHISQSYQIYKKNWVTSERLHMQIYKVYQVIAKEKMLSDLGSIHRRLWRVSVNCNCPFPPLSSVPVLSKSSNPYQSQAPKHGPWIVRQKSNWSKNTNLEIVMENA